MAQIIAIATQKGGTGKTTTAHMMALSMAHRGRKCLLVDADPQTNLPLAAGEAGTAGPTIADIFTGSAKAADAIRRGDLADIIPGSVEMVGAGRSLNSAAILRGALAPIRAGYDFIIIDCPASLDVLALNALTAADRVIIPCGCTVFDIQGLALFLDTVRTVRESLNSGLEVAGLLITRIDPRTTLAKDYTEQLQKLSDKYNIYQFRTRIREGNPIKRYQAEGADPFTKYRNASPVRDYEAFITEYLEREDATK